MLNQLQTSSSFERVEHEYLNVFVHKNSGVKVFDSECGNDWKAKISNYKNKIEVIIKNDYLIDNVEKICNSMKLAFDSLEK